MRKHNYVIAAIMLSLAAMVMLSGCILAPWPPYTPWTEADTTLLIHAEWNSEVENLDLLVSYPVPDSVVVSFDVPEYTEVNDSYATGVVDGYIGFFPEDGTPKREQVWSDAPESTYGGYDPSVELIDSDSYGGPETIAVREIPFATDFDGDYIGEFATNPSISPDTNLPVGYRYAWVGVMEVYVYAPDEVLSTGNGGGADAVVFLTMADDVIASFDLPEYIDAQYMSIARINLFIQRDSFGDVYNFYQIVTDMRLYNSPGEFRGLTDGEQAVINVQGARVN